MSTYDYEYKFLPNLSQAEIQATQLKGLRFTLEHCLKNSAFYQKHLQEAGLKSGKDINSLGDLLHLPLTTPEHLKAGYPFPLLSVPEEEISRIHASSGTTGKKKVMTYTAKDVQTFSLMMARCYELAGLKSSDRVQIAVGYGLWTAGVGFQLGCEHFGAMAIPLGPGNVELHLQFLQDMGSTCLASTASMALLMAEEVARNDLLDKIKLKKAIFGAEPHSLKMRKIFERKLGLEDSFDIAGMTEMYGPGSGLECSAHTGIHYWADLFIIEFLDPETLKPVGVGESGEMVVTSLCKEASPLIRYRTGDLSRAVIGNCPCGLTMPRHDKILGRSDDMIIFRGVNVYPGQIVSVLQHFPELGSEYHIELLHQSDGRDQMILSVERNPDAKIADLEILIKAVTRDIQKNISVTPKVQVVEPGHLPRSFGKSKRVTDKRM